VQESRAVGQWFLAGKPLPQAPVPTGLAMVSTSQPVGQPMQHSQSGSMAQ